MSRIPLLNPPRRSIDSRVPGQLLLPLGLLQIGGPLIDAGHDVRLITADIAPMDLPAILFRPDRRPVLGANSGGQFRGGKSSCRTRHSTAAPQATGRPVLPAKSPAQR